MCKVAVEVQSKSNRIQRGWLMIASIQVASAPRKEESPCNQWVSPDIDREIGTTAMFTVIAAFAAITSNMARAEGVPPFDPLIHPCRGGRQASPWLDVVRDH